jgi:hypothetical protein
MIGEMLLMSLILTVALYFLQFLHPENDDE